MNILGEFGVEEENGLKIQVKKAKKLKKKKG